MSVDREAIRTLRSRVGQWCTTEGTAELRKTTVIALLAALEETEAERDNLAITVAWNAMRRAVAEGPEAELVALRARLDTVMSLLHRADGQLGLAVYRGDHTDEWKAEAKRLISAIRAFLADGPNTEGTT